MKLTEQIKTISGNLVIEADSILLESERTNYLNGNDVSQLVRKYNSWYSKAQVFCLKLSPENIDNLKKLYEAKEKDITTISYFFKNPKHWHSNYDYESSGYYSRDEDHYNHFRNNFSAQIAIIDSLPLTIEYEALKLSQLVARDLLFDELEQATLLLDKDFIECAGMLAGVAMERQLKVLADNSSPQVIYSDKDTLGSLNDKLKTSYVDPSDYLRVKAIKTTRDRCSHDPGTKPPSKHEVEMMIADVKSFIQNH